MKVRVKLFAAARELAGRDVVTVEVTHAATVADVQNALLTSVPALAMIAPHAMWAVDKQYAPDDTRVSESSEVALIPPVSGG